jgi:hypothetical protein
MSVPVNGSFANERFDDVGAVLSININENKQDLNENKQDLNEFLAS